MSLEATAGAESAKSDSEFALPLAGQKILSRILKGFIEPYGERMATATKKRKNAIDKAASDLAAANAKIRSALKDIEARKEKTASFVETMRSQMQNIESEAIQFLNANGAIIPEKLDDPIQVQMATERECGSTLGFIEHEFNALHRKKLPWWPKNGWARAAIIVSTFYYGSGLLWFLIVGISHAVWAEQTKKTAQSFLAACQRLEVQLIAILETAAEQAKKEISGIKATLGEAAALAHKSALEAAELGFQRDVHMADEEYRPVEQEIRTSLLVLDDLSGTAVAPWESDVWQHWLPDQSPEFAARLGTLANSVPDNSPSKLNFSFEVPALIPFADGRCLLLTATDPSGRDRAADALLGAMVRVLANTPPGKARFTFIDPIGLGKNVADFMHLGDVNRDLISGKAWSEPQHIEQQLTLLTEHLETVIQTSLRNEFPDIRAYNKARQEVAQPFRFLVVYDYPANFTESSARRLTSIIRNGPRCGVYTFIVWDKSKKLAYGIEASELESAAVLIEGSSGTGRFIWRGDQCGKFALELDSAPPKQLIESIVRKSGEVALPAMKIDVPFDKLLASASLSKDAWWKASGARGVEIPLGPAGARAIQELRLGGDQEAHGLLVGRTGSGKTNLMHVIITALALKYSPDEVQLYLIDFKGGVGFKRYADHKLPHARVIAIESEREFGMSVLNGIDAELKRRSDLFRAAGVDGLGSYQAKARAAGSNLENLPRLLLIVDEFQEFFTENDDLGQQAKVIFERLARQGRSFGIHFLLATQSLSGSAQLPASIMGQVKVRIALPCSEADSRLILADDNKAARALSLPGEGIYNPMGGLVEGNNRFQVARFSDDDLTKYLSAISEAHSGGHRPLIFEGNELADVRESFRLKGSAARPSKASGLELYLGEPVAIAPPLAAILRKQSGRNLMILTREESEGVGIVIAALMSMLVKTEVQSRVVLADFSTVDSSWSQLSMEIGRVFGSKVEILKRQRDIGKKLSALAKEVETREGSSETVALVLLGMHRMKPLREDVDDEDGVNAVESLKQILRDGPEVGVHVVAWADTWGNATRGLDRRAMGEFGMKVAGVMDSGDSMNFVDSLAASKISKPNRALFYDEDRPGRMTLFRPFAPPPNAWIAEAANTPANS